MRTKTRSAEPSASRYIVLLFHGGVHALHDGSGAPPAPAHERAGLNLTISENAGTGDRLDMLCGRFVFTAPHERLLRDYLPARLVVQAADHSASTARPGTSAQLAGLVSLLRIESAVNSLGGRAMLNALSTAMFALTLRLASEAPEAPAGLLALAGHPRLGRHWRPCFMSRAARGICRSWRAFATCRGQQWRAIFRRNWGVPPASY